MAAPSSTQNCPDNCGSMPGCAPLAVPYVPFQQTDPKRYERMEALSEGTLFPGLNLPFHLMKNGREVARTPRTELQALAFIIQELGLYLDTHPHRRRGIYALSELCRTAGNRDVKHFWSKSAH